MQRLTPIEEARLSAHVELPVLDNVVYNAKPNSKVINLGSDTFGNHLLSRFFMVKEYTVNKCR